jgi:hypothetical protein
MKHKMCICQYIGCSTQSSFNFPNESKGIFCLEHKREGMIDICHNNVSMKDVIRDQVIIFQTKAKEYSVNHI